MYRVLIADDEPKVCRLIEKVVDWKALNLEIAGIVENGIEALASMEKEKVDIIITDIQMPGCDGLELIEKAKKINPQIGVVIISGYSRFEYAQKAIRYGVEDYLLKPIEETELTRILRKLVEGKERTTEEKESKAILKEMVEEDSRKIRENLMTGMIMEPQTWKEKLDREKINNQYRCEFRPGIYQVVVIKADITRKRNERESYELLQKQVRTIAENELRKGSLEMLSFTAPEGTYILLNYGLEYEKELRKRLKTVRSKICAMRDLFWDIQATVGLGNAVNALNEVSDSIQCARRAILNRIYLGLNHTIGVNQKEAYAAVLEDIIDTKSKAKLIDGIETLNKSEILKLITRLKEQTKSVQIDGELLLRICEELIDTLTLGMKKMFTGKEVRYIKERFIEEYHMCTTVDEVFKTLEETFGFEIDGAVKQLAESEIRPIREVRKYIQKHYGEDIKLEDISIITGFNSNYFSGLFKKHVGMGFAEYLTEVRIKNAKSFLIQGELTAAEIAERTGYNDVKYFYKAFKRTTGMTPKEFKALYQRLD